MSTIRFFNGPALMAGRPAVIENDCLKVPVIPWAETVEIELDEFTVPMGREGYFLIPNVRSSSSCGGLITFRERPDITESYDEGFSVPVFGVCKGSAGLLAAVTAGRYDYSLRVEVREGKYKLLVIFRNFAGTPEIRFFPLQGREAAYSGMARCYRKFQLDRGVCRPLKERCAENPLLAQSVRSLMVRVRMAWKPVPPEVLEQTDANEPPLHVAVTFKRAMELLRRCKEAGIGDLEFCLVGWNKGGHDGAFPDLFPVEEALGGEKELRELLKYAQSCGYLMAAHTNLVDSYSFSERCTPHDRLVDADGTFHLGGRWGGGQSYYLCPKQAHERFAKADFVAVKELGFRGTHYLDVASIKQPDACFHPDHPLTKEEGALWRSRTLALAREILGASSSEGSIDFCIGDLDFVLYANFGIKPAEPPVLFDRFVPFWTLVYHGIVTSNCSFSTINEMVKNDPELTLYNLEWGGRPTGYFHANFRTEHAAKPQLCCATDEELEMSVKALAARAAEFEKLRDLQLEFIDEHEEIAPGVIRERYANGAVMLINRSKEPFGDLPPMSWRRERADD